MDDEDATTRSNATGPRPVRGRLLRLAAAALIGLGIYALVGFFLVPPLVRWAVQTKGSAALHRTTTLRAMSFNPFTLRARFDGLGVRDRDGSPLLSCGRVELRLGLSGLFVRAWRFSELTIETPAVVVRILPDGKLSIADLLESKDESPPPRLIIDRLVIRGGKIDFVDESVAPRYLATFAPMNASVRDLVTLPDKRGEHSLSIGFDKSSTIRLTGGQSLTPFTLSGRLDARRIALPDLAQRLSPGAVVQLRKGEVDLSIRYSLRHGESGGLQLDVTGGELTATGLALSPRGASDDRLSIPRLEVRDATLHYPARRVEIGSIRLVGPRGAIGWDRSGRFNWAGPGAPATKPAGSNAAPAPRWTMYVGKVAVSDGAMNVDDLQPATPVHLDLSSLAIEATGLSDVATAPIGLTAEAIANGTGRISLHGILVPSPFSLDSQVALASIDLLPFRPYTDKVPGLTLAGGSLQFDGHMLFSGQQPYLVEGNSVVSGIAFLDAGGRRLLGCRTATLRNVRLDGASLRYRIQSADLDGLYANIAIDKQRNLNLSAIGAAPAGAAPAAAPATGNGSVDIGTVDVRNSTIDYRDDSLSLPFAASIVSTTGRITDFSTTGTAASTIRFDGNVAEHGSMKAEGTLRAADPFAGTDLTMRFRNVPMPTLTPYSAEFAGYAIERGSLDLDLHYRIVARKLTGNHRVLATDLTLGKKVGGSRAGFAVRLAIALLKDHNGRIDLQVPIEGSVDSPEFNYRVVFWQALKTILGNVVKAPFRTLGKAMGIGDGNLDSVRFDPGESIVSPPEAEKLQKIAGELALRPELRIEVEGCFDPALDGAAIRKEKLARQIAERRDAPRAGAKEPPSLEAILETLYAESFSPARLAEERAKFTTAAALPPAPEPAKKRLWHKAPPPAPAAPPAPVSFDAGRFYDEIRAQLVTAEPVGPDELRALGRARADAIRVALAAGGTLPSARVRSLEPAAARRVPEAGQVVSGLTLSATGDSVTGTPDD